MYNSQIPFILPALPEIIMACGSMVLLIFGVFRKKESTELISWLSIWLMLGVLLFVIFGETSARTFSDIFIVDSFSVYSKSLVLIGSLITLAMSIQYIIREGMNRFEYPILILLATLGMMMMISSNDLISLYVGIELQSLALYVLAAFKRDTLKSTEAGLKYFVLGALSSGMLLYGASMIYGFSGSTNFEVIKAIYSSGEVPSIGFIVGIVFLISGIAFKISAVPFHMWTPDVYEGATTPVTAFIAIAPKVAAMALFLRIVFVPFESLINEWQQVVIVISVASMVLGSFAAIRQTNIKRLMAFSSISHMGFALLGLVAGSEQGLQSVLIYLLIYMVMNIGTFAAILTMRVNGAMVESIFDLGGLGKTNPFLGLAISIFMFSLAGIPPLAGFFAKFYVFLAAIESGLYVISIIGVLSSAVGAYYYLRIVKIIYFDDPADSFDKPIAKTLIIIISISALFSLFFIIFPSPIISWTSIASMSLFQ